MTGVVRPSNLEMPRDPLGDARRLLLGHDADRRRGSLRARHGAARLPPRRDLSGTRRIRMDCRSPSPTTKSNRAMLRGARRRPTSARARRLRRRARVERPPARGGGRRVRALPFRRDRAHGGRGVGARLHNRPRRLLGHRGRSVGGRPTSRWAGRWPQRTASKRTAAEGRRVVRCRKDRLARCTSTPERPMSRVDASSALGRRTCPTRARGDGWPRVDRDAGRGHDHARLDGPGREPDVQ